MYLQLVNIFKKLIFNIFYMSLGIFANEFILVHFTYIFKIKGGDLQLMLFSFCVHSCSCIMACWWPVFGG